MAFKTNVRPERHQFCAFASFSFNGAGAASTVTGHWKRSTAIFGPHFLGDPRARRYPVGRACCPRTLTVQRSELTTDSVRDRAISGTSIHSLPASNCASLSKSSSSSSRWRPRRSFAGINIDEISVVAVTIKLVEMRRGWEVRRRPGRRHMDLNKQNR